MYKFFKVTGDTNALESFIEDLGLVILIKPDHYEFAFEDPDTHELRYVREGWGHLKARPLDVLYIDNGNLYRLDLKMVGVIDAWRKWTNES